MDSGKSESANEEPVVLAARGIRKAFPGVLAVNDVSLELKRGEVLALVGENGAGKSTLMKTLAGIHRPDAGEIILDGKPVRIQSPREAQELGIALIHQELNLCDNLDVAANIVLGHEPAQFGLLQRRRAHAPVTRVLEQVGLKVAPSTLVSRLSIGHQQLVEIAKALAIDARILIMDEPTSSLTQRETDKLFAVMESLKARGVSVIYISHRLAEIEKIADRVIVLRDGRNAGELTRNEISHDRMVPLMVGRDVSRIYSRSPHPPGEAVLQVENLVTPAWPGISNSFSIRAGEVVGIAGLVGAGRTELLHALFGIDPPVSGKLEIDGQSRSLRSPAAAIDAGLALVPEDRKQNGLVLPWSVAWNTTLPQLGNRFSRYGMIRKRQEATQGEEEIERLSIRARGANQIVGLLSGGNQQKVVIGKWLVERPQLLMLDEPTRGVDIGAKQEIYRLMDQLAGEGMAVLFVSSELEEILGLSDRVLVMHEGQITGELTRDELSEEAIMQLATQTTTCPGAT